ncbi:MAG: hypothetical protein HQL87_15275 [Magnetococcales bacterium]|nr:hypothetical protein [Magnetococcales bacterium]
MPIKITRKREWGWPMATGGRSGRVGMVMAVLLAGLWCSGNALATSIHHNGCDNPVEDVQVCWDAVGDAGEEFAPFSEVHLLPIAWDRQGDQQLLADYSRAVFRQFLPSGFADNLVQEWVVATHLEEAFAVARLHQWALTLWISPRILRESSATGSGIVDWDVYLIKHGKLLRTLRVRAEARATRASQGPVTGTAMGAALVATGAAVAAPFSSAAAVAGTVAISGGHPPEAGRPMELMTEFVVRQILTSFKEPMEQLESTKPPSPVMQKASGWVEQVFSPK